MNRLLFIDAWRRMRRGFVLLAGFAGLLWFLGVWSGASPGMLMALSMAATAGLGALSVGQAVAPREVWLLPISRQEIWKTRWWMSGPVVTGVMLLGKIAGGVAASFVTPTEGILQTVAISSLLDFAFVGVEIWLTVLVTVTGLRTGQSRRTAVAVACFTLALAAQLTWPVLPLGGEKYLPTVWTDFTTGWAIVLMAGAATTIAAFLHTPRLGARPGAAASRAVLQARKPSRWPSFANVTGVRRLMLKTWLGTAGFQVVMPFMLVGMVRLMDSFTGDQPEAWLDHARRFGFMPFDPGKDYLGLPWIMLSIFSSMGTDSVGSMLRHLRALPLGIARLNLTLMSVSVICWINAFLVLVGFHILATGRAPVNWQIPMFLAFAGYDCLFRAIYLRRRGVLWFLLALPVLVAAGVLIAKHEVPLTLAFLTTGPASYALAYWLNHGTLTRHRAIYAVRPRTVFGVEVPTP